VSMSCLRQTDAGVEIFLYIQPRASRNKVVALVGEELKVALTAPPVDGAANKACIAFLAKLCSHPKSSVKLISGETSRHKRLFLGEAKLQEISDLLKEMLGG